MRVEATLVLKYEIPDDPRTLEAYGASSMGEVLVKETDLLEQDGDYLLSQLADRGTEVMVIGVVKVPATRASNRRDREQSAL